MFGLIAVNRWVALTAGVHTPSLHRAPLKIAPQRNWLPIITVCVLGNHNVWRGMHTRYILETTARNEVNFDWRLHFKRLVKNLSRYSLIKFVASGKNLYAYSMKGGCPRINTSGYLWKKEKIGISERNSKFYEAFSG